MQRLRILEFLGFRCGEKKTIFLETRYFINAFFTKNKKQKKTKQKGRGRIVSSVIENLLEMRPNRPK